MNIDAKKSFSVPIMNKPRMNSGKQFYLQKLQKMPKYKLNQGCERFLQ
jgi:hypothetical protein